MKKKKKKLNKKQKIIVIIAIILSIPLLLFLTGKFLLLYNGYCSFTVNATSISQLSKTFGSSEVCRTNEKLAELSDVVVVARVIEKSEKQVKNLPQAQEELAENDYYQNAYYEETVIVVDEILVKKSNISINAKETISLAKVTKLDEQTNIVVGGGEIINLLEDTTYVLFLRELDGILDGFYAPLGMQGVGTVMGNVVEFKYKKPTTLTNLRSL